MQLARLRPFLPALLGVLAACHPSADTTAPRQRTEGDVVRLVVAPDTTLLYVGQTFQLVTQAFAGDGKAVAGVSARWSVVEGESVSLTENGQVTALRPGRTVVSAKTTNAEARSRIGVVVPGS